MKSFVFATIGLCLLMASPVLAQEPMEVISACCPDTLSGETSITLLPSSVQATSEMWFYQQEKKERLSPAMAVRRKAEFKSAQRQARLAAMKWFGYSNLRPSASPDPINGCYSPFWAGNNKLSPYMWSGRGPTVIVLRRGKTQR